VAVFEQLRVPFPSALEQSRIADQLDAIHAVTRRLESIYQKLAALDELKKSLLHQAFAGQL
jgi:type I restriction enzyme S subunit